MEEKYLAGKRSITAQRRNGEALLRTKTMIATEKTFWAEEAQKFSMPFPGTLLFLEKYCSR